MGLLLLLAGLTTGAGRAGDAARPPADGFVVREWRAEPGLPSDDVYQLAQDARGYLWVATRAGVVRFDGATFFPVPGAAGRDLYLNLLPEADGSVLLGPRAGDPIRFQAGGWRKEPLAAPLAGQPAGQALRAPDGALWSSVRGAVQRVRGADRKVFGPADGIAEGNWTRFALDGAGRVWLACDQLLARYEDGGLVRVPLPIASELRLASSRSAGPWVITDRQVYKLDGASRPVPVAELPPLVGAHYVAAAVEDSRGWLWLGTRSQGVHVVGREGVIPVPTSSDNITTLIEDREGTIWAAAIPGGLYAIAPRIYTLHTKANGLPATGVTAVCEPAPGEIWCANGDGGVVRLRDGRVDQWTLRHAGRVYGAVSVAPHPARGVWVTGSSSAFWVDGEGGVTFLDAVPSSGPQPASFTSAAGEWWLTMADGRVGRWNGQTFQSYGAEAGLSERGVRSFGSGVRGEVLVGTNDGQLLRFAAGKFVPLLPAGVSLGVALNGVLAMDDGYWLATAGEGLVVVTPGRIARVNSLQGLPHDNLTQLVPDGRGFVWCGSTAGVFRVAVEEVRRVAAGEAKAVSALQLGRDEGLGDASCRGLYGPGALRSRDGRVWFATRQGLLAINPEAEALSPPAPQAALEEIRIDGEAQVLRAPLVVDPAGHKLEFSFSALALAAPSRVRTRYRLVGFDDGWVEAGPRRVAVYPRLPPGEYRFEVAASYGPPREGDAPAVMAITVPRLWWQRLWFQAAALLVLIGAVAGIVRVWTYRRLRRRIERLEHETAIARERARIAQNIHDDVGASLTRISLLTQASSPQSPEAPKLERIYETAREITRSFDQIVWAVNPQYDSLESFVGYLTDFAPSFLGLARVRCRLDIPAVLPPIVLSGETRHQLFLCCREALNNVVKHARATEVTIRLAWCAPRLRIVIADNGRGLDAAAADPRERGRSRHGLANLRERMARLGGSGTVKPAPEGGTVVTLSVALGGDGVLSP